MKQKKNVRKIKRRLITGIFCISLFVADLASVTSVWAKEPVAAEQAQESLTDVSDGEEGGDEMSDPEDGNGGADTQNPDNGESGDNVRNPEEDDSEDDTENPDEGNGGDDAQNSGGDGVTDDAADNSEDKPEVPDGEDTPVPDEQPSVSENDPEEQEPSVSENDMDVLGEVRTLAVPADAIASGSYKDVTWVIDADGKLTVEGTGDFTDKNGLTRAPWCALSTRNKIKTAEVRVTGMTNASYMFYLCSKLTSISFAGSDTNAVTDMSRMFCECPKLETISFGDFKTEKVTSMENMFSGCRSLSELDLHSFDTACVTNMSGMFASCSSLTDLDVSGFNTCNVTKMYSMFGGCSGLTSLDVSNFDTRSVTDMRGMFSQCFKLESLDLHNFNTEAVGLTAKNAGGLESMFSQCASMKNLDISGFDISHTDSLYGMFVGCSALSHLDVSNFDTSNIVNMREMFEGCSSLTDLDLSSFDTSKVTNMGGMFGGCSALTTLDLSGFNFTAVISANEMFDSCSKLQKLYTPYHVKVDASATLPMENSSDKWYRSDDKTEIAALPVGLDHSILVTRNQILEVTEHIAACKTKTTYICGETIALDDLTVTYYGADGSVRKLAAEQYTTNAVQINMAEAGEKKLTVTYVNGDTSLTAEIVLTVTYGLGDATTTVTLPAETGNYIYDGQAKTPKPVTVSYANPAAGSTGTPVTLTEGKDYSLSYRNNINAYEQPASGSAASPAVIIKGIGDYSGTVTKTFAIKKSAAPAAETMDVTGSQCAQANPNRTIDLTGSFTACGKKTGYEITAVQDTKNIFSRTPVTADIRDGVLTYGTRAAQEGDTASIKVKVSFQNYRDAELTVRITMAAKKAAEITGITMRESSVYSGIPVSYSGEAAVRAADGTDLTGKVALTYRYSGTMSDGTAYPSQGGGTGNSGTEEPPVNAGNYVLTVSVSIDDPDYTGSVTYPFTITQADAVVRAKDMVVLMQMEGEDSIPVPAEQYRKDFGYTVTGLLNADTLRTEPAYTVTEDEAGEKTVTTIDISKTGTYYIHPFGADAGMNYDLSYENGILTVSEERVAYTVTLDGMGHCGTFTKSGIKSGALLELTEEEQMPAAKEPGYVFAGWFKDKTFDRKKEWNFDTDTVQSDLTLYACWLTAAEDGAGLRLCVQDISDLAYTGSAWKPAVTVYDSDGTTLLKAGKDYTVKYVRNTDAVAVDGEGRPVETGGTAKVTNPGRANEQLTDVAGHFSKNCPYVVITGKGNYAETVYRNFLILPTQISGKAAADPAGQTYDTPLAAGFTLKYTDQLVVNVKKEQKPFSSMKYKKGMKAGTDFTVTLGVAEAEGALDGEKRPLAADWKAEGTLNAGKQYTLPAIPKGYSGAFTLTVTGKGNYTGVVTRKLYVSEKQKLMKNVTITLGKNQKNIAYTGEDVLLTPGYYDAGTKKNYKVTSAGVVGSTPEANANDMFLVKAGKESLVWGRDYTIDYAGTNRAVGTATMTLTGRNGYVGTKSVTFKITGAKFAANTIEVKAYDVKKPSEPQADAFRASLPYTGRAVTQNQVVLRTKATQKEPEQKELVYGEHYTIAYKNNVKKGNATMTFTAKPESGYSGSFQKTFKITAQELSEERLTVTTPVGGDKTPEAVYSKNGAKLSFTVTNEAGTVLREGTDYTVKYKNNTAVTKAQTEDNKKPLMTVTGKGNYMGKAEVTFKVVQASLVDALDEGTVQVSCAQVQKKNGMKFKDLKFKLVEGKKTLGMGEKKDYVIDETGCTPEIFKAYADAIAVGTALPDEPVVKVTGKGFYTGEKTIPLGKYIYADKLTAANLYVVVSEGAGQSIYTGGQVTPDVEVYYGEKTAVSAAKKDKVKDDAALTAQGGKYKLKKLAQKSSGDTGDGGNAGNVKDADYTVSYGANIAAGKNKGSVTVTGTGRYGGSVTVKFEIGKKSIY